MSKASRSRRKVAYLKEHPKKGHNCNNPDMVNLDVLNHEKGVCVADTDIEDQWTYVCKTCGYVDTSEV